MEDAQDLNLRPLAFLQELTDNLAAPPYQRPLGLCCVAAHGKNEVPFRELFAGPEIRWQQFQWRLETEHRASIVPGHTEEELRPMLVTVEDLYRKQLPDLHFSRWTKPLFTPLPNPILDPEATGRVTMHHLTKLVTIALRRAYEGGATDVAAALLGEVANVKILRRDEITQADAPFPADPETEREVS